jgi:hypothetical protein
MVSRAGRFFLVWSARGRRASRTHSLRARASHTVCSLLVCLLYLGCCARVSAQTGSTELTAPALLDTEQQSVLGDTLRESAPFSLNGKLESSLGQGSFLRDSYERNAHFVWAVSLCPAYYPRSGVALSAYAKLLQDLTQSDVDTERQQFLISDTQLRARWAVPLPSPKTQLFVEGRTYLPSSRISRFETLVLGALARFSVAHELRPFAVSFLGQFRKNFHRYTSPVLDDDALRGDAPSAYARAGGAEDLRGLSVGVAGNNVSFSTYGTASLSYAPLPALSLSIYYGLGRAWTYTRYRVDEQSSPHAVAGRGKRDTGVAGLDVSYRLNERFSFSTGVVTIASPKTEDNRSFRFPFYDFQSTASNLTLFYLDVTVTQLLGG